VSEPPAPTPAGGTHRRRRPRWPWIAAVAVLVLAAGGLIFGRGDGHPTVGKGQAAAIDLPRLNGEGNVSLATLRGHPVVVNFFASWCEPCRKEMPAMQTVSTKLRGKVDFVGVNHQDNRDGALQLLNQTGVRYPTGYDPDGKIATEYGLFGMPTTLFVSPDGRLLEKHTGELTQSQLEQTISRLFNV
jgi:cytochrome c biogenesis protein CcmG/thiol:disulfide interchange protein DsbE